MTEYKDMIKELGREVRQLQLDCGYYIKDIAKLKEKIKELKNTVVCNGLKIGDNSKKCLIVNNYEQQLQAMKVDLKISEDYGKALGQIVEKYVAMKDKLKKYEEDNNGK